jgi:hypothetical protein
MLFCSSAAAEWLGLAHEAQEALLAATSAPITPVNWPTDLKK